MILPSENNGVSTAAAVATFKAQKYPCMFLTYHLFHQHFPDSIEWDVIAFLYRYLVVAQTENFHQSLCLSANKGDEGQQANISTDFLLKYISILHFIRKKRVSFVHMILNYFCQKISEYICEAAQLSVKHSR